MFRSQFFVTVCTIALSGGLPFGALAGEYPMTGQDGVFESVSGAPLVLKDYKGKDLVLENGAKMRFRMSNASKSFHIMLGNGHRQELKVPGGFPGGDLQRFKIRGEEYGNPGISLTANVRTLILSERRATETQGCSYACGQEYVCRQIPDGQNCYNENVCERDTVCRNGHCEPVTRCHNVQRCETTYRESCGYETRYCSGSETVNVAYRNKAKVLSMIFGDEAAAAPLGTFKSTLKTSHERDHLGTVTACH